MNFIMIQSNNTINYCLDAISELNQFSVQNKSIDFASSERRESAWRVNSNQSPQVVHSDKKAAVYDQRTEASKMDQKVLNSYSPESAEHGPEPFPPPQKILWEKITPSGWSCSKQTESLTARIPTCHGMSS